MPKNTHPLPKQRIGSVNFDINQLFDSILTSLLARGKIMFVALDSVLITVTTVVFFSVTIVVVMSKVSTTFTFTPYLTGFF